jgi:hypothetical protein
VAETLSADITGSGMNQGDLVKVLGNLRDVVNELITDHALFKTQVAADVASINLLRTSLYNRPMGNPGFAIDTNFDVKNANAISYTNNGTLKSLAANTSFDTGTSQVIATSGKWSAALLSVSNAGAATVTWSATLNAATEAAAIAALPALPANHTPLGYITVQSHASNTWIAGTSALTTGTGGNVAQATNYYNLIDPLSAVAAATDASPASLTNTTPITLAKG